jgi:hypothetical protein
MILACSGTDREALGNGCTSLSCALKRSGVRTQPRNKLGVSLARLVCDCYRLTVGEKDGPARILRGRKEGGCRSYVEMTSD